ncbi:MAG TPA: hypothetical protein VMU84_00785 [Thermoanaerobaculia bacterium]|nr:hypothetical protein [Thermoanaerobaculia bacterium]
MGIVLWLGCGVLAFVVARLVPAARGRTWIELAVVIAAAAALGLTATALDFGGWRELDWRAGLFVCFGSFAAAGLLRCGILLTRPNGGSS